MNDNDIITIRNYRFNKNDIYDIYDIERDVDVFYNRQAGFVVETYGTANNPSQRIKFYEDIPYESTLQVIRQYKNKWEKEMLNAIEITDYSPIINWEQRRYEIAKDILAAFNPINSRSNPALDAKYAIIYVDALIK